MVSVRFRTNLVRPQKARSLLRGCLETIQFGLRGGLQGSRRILNACSAKRVGRRPLYPMRQHELGSDVWRCSLLFPQSTHELFHGNRQVSNTLAGRVKYGIGYRGRDSDDAELAVRAARDRTADLADRLATLQHRIDAAVATGYDKPAAFSATQFAGLAAQAASARAARRQADQALVTAIAAMATRAHARICLLSQLHRLRSAWLAPALIQKPAA